VIIVDASIASEILLGRPGDAAALERLFGANEDLHAPQLFDAEVAQVIRGEWLDDDISDEAGEMAIAFLRAFPITPFARTLSRTVWALRNNVTAYDAMYAALAESLNAPLITRDGRLARSSGHSARIRIHRIRILVDNESE
jgi:predicted nucleic acid-binding protein